MKVFCLHARTDHIADSSLYPHCHIDPPVPTVFVDAFAIDRFCKLCIRGPSVHSATAQS